MCISTPSTPPVPSIPERQTTQTPDQGSTAANVADAAKRRRGLYAQILTNQGTMGAPSTTASTTLG